MSKVVLPLVLMSFFAVFGGSLSFAKTPDAIATCDRLAASPVDSRRPAGIEGVPLDEIEADKAIEACRQAVQLEPANGRLLFELGRVLERQGKLEEAFKAYSEAAAKDYPSGWVAVGIHHLEGRARAVDHQLALLALRNAMFAGEVRAHYWLGVLYKELGPLQDLTMSSLHFERCLPSGMRDCSYKLSLAYRFGLGVRRDPERAFALATAAAEKGYIDAMLSVGRDYEIGIGVRKSPAKAEAWYRAAAKEGSGIGLLWASELVFEGPDNEAKLSDAIKAIEGLALKGDTSAAFDLGYAYEVGNGVPVDRKKAFDWYTIAASGMNKGALNNLGLWWQQEYADRGGELTKDEQRRILGYFRASANLDNPKAMLNIGDAYRRGELGLAAEPAKALDLYETAAFLGDVVGMKAAADLYIYGDETVKSPELGFEWYMRAASQADADAMFEVALAYDNGSGVKKSPEKALQWYRKAADLGIAGAMNNIGFFYRNGTGVRQDANIAFEWYLKATEAGDNIAPLNLAQCYRDGAGSSPDIKKASEQALLYLERNRAIAIDDFRKQPSDWPPDFWRRMQTAVKAKGLYAGPVNGKPNEALWAAFEKITIAD